MRILVVEDEPNLNEVISKKLKSVNYAVDSCFDGNAAEEYLAAAAYDIVVLDIMLPKKKRIIRSGRHAGERRQDAGAAAHGQIRN